MAIEKGIFATTNEDELIEYGKKRKKRIKQTASGLLAVLLILGTIFILLSLVVTTENSSDSNVLIPMLIFGIVLGVAGIIEFISVFVAMSKKDLLGLGKKELDRLLDEDEDKVPFDSIGAINATSFESKMILSAGSYLDYGTTCIGFDYPEENIMIVSRKGFSQQLSIDKILGCELKQNGETIQVTEKSHGVLRGIVGGVLFGGVGALVGAGTGKNKTTTKTEDDLSVVIYYNDLSTPFFTFEFGEEREAAETLFNTFKVIQARNSSAENK